MIFKICLGVFVFRNCLLYSETIRLWCEWKNVHVLQNLTSFANSLCFIHLGYKGMVTSWWLTKVLNISSPFSHHLSALLYLSCDRQHVRTLSLLETDPSGVQMASLIQRADSSLPQAPKTHTSAAQFSVSTEVMASIWALQIFWASNQLPILLMASNFFSCVIPLIYCPVFLCWWKGCYRSPFL